MFTVILDYMSEDMLFRVEPRMGALLSSSDTA